MKQFTAIVGMTYAGNQPPAQYLSELQDKLALSGVEMLVKTISETPPTLTYKFYIYRKPIEGGGYLSVVFTHRLKGNIMERVAVTIEGSDGFSHTVGGLNSEFPFETTDPQRLCKVTMLAHGLCQQEFDSFKAGIFHLAESLRTEGLPLIESSLV